MRLVAASWGLWLLFQLAPERTVVPWPIDHANTFPLAAWQLLFVHALVLGYHRAEIAAWLERAAERPLAVGMGFRLGLGAAAAVLIVLGAVPGTG